ncbi:MAG: ATP-binding protein [Roseococcus sp.]|nr:ATP-binding protein [Roseococcus sp.]
MALDVSDLILALLASGLGAAVIAGRARLAGQTAEVQTAQHLAAERGRALALLAQEVQSTSLSLLGRAQVLGGEAGRAFEAEARHLLSLSDQAAEAGSERERTPSLKEERFPLAPLLRETVALTAQRLGPGRRLWRVEPALEAVTLRADRRALRAALLEVLTRAVRATGEGDAIDLRLERARDSLALVVEDEGLGLGAEDLSPAVHDGGAPRSRGLGIGLVIARALLRAHGGELVLEAAEGVGARAFLSLPAERWAGG